MILLDTHVVIWLLIAPGHLSRKAAAAVFQARLRGEELGYSPVSLYEIANAVRRDRLRLHSTTAEFVAAIQTKLSLAPLTARIALCAAELPEPFHGDPMDRIIAATAKVDGHTLITRDARIIEAGVCKTLW